MNRLLPTLLALSSFALLPSACGSVQCEPAQACEDSETQVESCDGQEDCREVESCGETIGCVPAATCAAYPACPEDMREVAECPSGATCQTASICGTTILCAPEDCTASDQCTPDEFCAFPDGLCGQGQPGSCQPRPEFCSDGPNVCYCDGTTSDLGGPLPCRGNGGLDFDSSGSCALSMDKFSCAHRVCNVGENYCRITGDDTGGPPFADCGFLPQGCSDCSCLQAEADACGGTCTDGAFPTITCPGG